MTTTTETSEATILDILTSDLVPHPDNPRTDASADEQLLASVRSAGILEPLLVRWLTSPGGTGDVEPGDVAAYWQLLAGHRRLHAAIKLGLMTFPCLVRDVDDAGALEVLVAENMARKDLAPLEQARGLQLLVDAKVKPKDVATKLGWSLDLVRRRLALLTLPAKARVLLEDQAITLDVADQLAALPTAAAEELVSRGVPASCDIARKAREVRVEKLYRQADRELRKQGTRTVRAEFRYDLNRHGSEVSKMLLDPVLHAFEPCSAIALVAYGESIDQVHICTDPKRHDPKGESALKVPGDDEAERIREAEWAAQAAEADAERQRQRDAELEQLDDTDRVAYLAEEAEEEARRQAAEASRAAQVEEENRRREAGDAIQTYRLEIKPRLARVKIQQGPALDFLWAEIINDGGQLPSRDRMWGDLLAMLDVPVPDGVEDLRAVVDAYRTQSVTNRLRVLVAVMLWSDVPHWSRMEVHPVDVYAQAVGFDLHPELTAAGAQAAELHAQCQELLGRLPVPA